MAVAKVHHLKILECYADAVYYGDKTFEIRNDADRGFQRGDLIRFTVIDADRRKVDHILQDETFEITYVLPYVGLKEFFVALSIRNIRARD